MVPPRLLTLSPLRLNILRRGARHPSVLSVRSWVVEVAAVRADLPEPRPPPRIYADFARGADEGDDFVAGGSGGS
jgi:hypothetical protein